MSKSRMDVSGKYIYQGLQDLPDSKMIEDARNEQLDQPRMIEMSSEFYIPDPRLVEVVNLALVLGRPLLLQGDPGCGKTRLAYAAAYELGLPIEECYIKSTSKAQDFLYAYDAINRLYDAQLQDPRSKEAKNYIRLGPLGRAIARANFERRSVVLIDEIDKADLDFPNDLLLELDRLWFQVAEVESMRYSVPDDRPDLRPLVIITHNEEKALPAAFLRRCVYYYVKMPETIGQLQRILANKGYTDTAVTRKAAEVLLAIRKLDLNKKPGLSELLDWVGFLGYQKIPLEQFETLPFISALLKDQADQVRTRAAFNLPADTPAPDPEIEQAGAAGAG